MTRDEYLARLRQMEPRELDAEVAEKIFGYTWQVLDGDTVLVEPESDANYFRTYWPNRSRDYLDPKLDMLPYSTDIAAAWEVVEKFDRKEWDIIIESATEDDGLLWGIELWHYYDDETNPDEYSASESTAPLAICIAACLAHWAESPGPDGEGEL